MLDPQVLGYKLVLGSHIVIEQHFGEGPQVWSIRRGRGLAVAKKRSDDDVVFRGVECLVRADQPEIVGYAFEVC